VKLDSRLSGLQLVSLRLKKLDYTGVPKGQLIVLLERVAPAGVYILEIWRVKTA
jgi:hypothetical protein